MTLQKKFEQAARATDRYTDIIVKDRLYAAYKESLDVVRSQTATLYEKHAKDGILTMGEVSKYNRLANLEKDIAAEMTRLGGKQVSATTQVIKGVYQESAYRTAYALNTEMPDIALNFGLLPTKQVEQAILNPMDRIGWPNRTREQIAIANRQVREVITQGIIQGKPYPDMARDIKERFDMAAYKAERIVRTEAHRARSMGQLATLEEAHAQGVEMVKVWISAMDDRVRDSHGAMDGQKVEMFDEEGNPGKFTSGAGHQTEAPGMFGVAKEDINCRCSIRGEVPGYEPTERRERLTEEEYNQRVAAEAERAAKENRDPLPIARSEIKPYRTYPEYAKEKGFPSLYKGAEPRVVGAVLSSPDVINYAPGTSRQPITMSRDEFVNNIPEGFKYEAHNDFIARRTADKQTILTDRFFERNQQSRRMILNHEIGHDLMRGDDFNKIWRQPLEPFIVDKRRMLYDDFFSMSGRPAEDPAEKISNTYMALFEPMSKGYERGGKTDRLLRAVARVARERGLPVPDGW